MIIELVSCSTLSIYLIAVINSFKIKINKGVSKQVGSKFKMFLKELVGVRFLKSTA